MIRKWAVKFLEALQRAVAQLTTLDQILLGAILGFVLLMILGLLGFFN